MDFVLKVTIKHGINLKDVYLKTESYETHAFKVWIIALYITMNLKKKTWWGVSVISLNEL